MTNEVKPDNFLVWAILSTLFCCLPLGIVAIVYSTKVNPQWEVGNYQQAYENASKAKSWTMASVVCGLIAFVISFISGFLSAFLG